VPFSAGAWAKINSAVLDTAFAPWSQIDELPAYRRAREKFPRTQADGVKTRPMRQPGADSYGQSTSQQQADTAHAADAATTAESLPFLRNAIN
jgi:hypothetical protein